MGRWLHFFLEILCRLLILCSELNGNFSPDLPCEASQMTTCRLDVLEESTPKVSINIEYHIKVYHSIPSNMYLKGENSLNM